MSNDIKHFLFYLFSTHVSLVKYVFRSFAYKIGWFAFLLQTVRDLYLILGRYFCCCSHWYFLSICVLIFISLMVSFKEKVLIFSIVSSACFLWPDKSLSYMGQWNFFLSFIYFWKFYSLAFTYRSVILWFI